ncbi:hypothetical protein OG21DRAFT_1478836 [Imleria badia]|nr:hypothetical protein OG21DRAFT_1478836 [Imleria badia]
MLIAHTNPWGTSQESEQPRNNVFDRTPAELVDLALSTLQAAGVQLTEWRALLYRRMNVPVIVKDYSYIVPDSDLAAASDILKDVGLPVSPPSRLLTRVEGDIHTKGRFHRLTRSSAPAWAQHLVLFPASFISLTPEEVSPAPSIHLSPSVFTTTIRCPTILVSRPSAVFAWIIRTMAIYPKSSSVRTILSSDLSELVDYHLLHVQDGYINPDEEPERWQELDLDRRIAQTIKVILRWAENHEWRDGEEWFGDALGAIVSGVGEIEYLPASDC